jgi:hypothetical protein
VSECEHDRIRSERAYIERPEGEFPMGIVGVCLDCDAPMTLSGDEDDEGHATWEIDYNADELTIIRRQGA